MSNIYRMNFTKPGEVRKFELGTLELLQMNGSVIGKFTLQPGWAWSKHVKPIAKTEWCEAPHFQYHLSGTLHIVMKDGTEFDAVAGDVTQLPSGHDAWVVGDEPVVLIDWSGTAQYAKK